MILNNVTLTGNFRVTHVDPSSGNEIFDKIVSIEYGNSLTLLKGFYDLFFFDLPNGKLLGKNIQQDIPLSNILIGMGDGSTKTFNFTLEAPVKPGTLKITYKYNNGTDDVTETAQDDGNGNITATNISSATIDYSTGAGTLTFNDAIDANTPITGEYTLGSASDDSLQLGFYFDLATDQQPTTDATPFSNIVTLSNKTMSIVDWYQTEQSNIYKMTMEGVFDSATALTDKVTAIQFGFQAAQGSASDVTVYDQLIMKSLAPMKSDLFGDDGLLLANKTTVKLDLMFSIRK